MVAVRIGTLSILAFAVRHPGGLNEKASESIGLVLARAFSHAGAWHTASRIAHFPTLNHAKVMSYLSTDIYISYVLRSLAKERKCV